MNFKILNIKKKNSKIQKKIKKNQKKKNFKKFQKNEKNENFLFFFVSINDYH